MPISADSQFQIRSTVFGTGLNDLWFDAAQVQGLLGVPEPKTSDVDLWNQQGAEGNPEYAGVRLITIPALIVSTSTANAVAALATLRTAWVASQADITLQVRLGGVTYQVNGRPRGFKEDLSRWKTFVAHVLLRFDALDPTLSTV